MEIAKRKRRAAAPKATQRVQRPRIRRMPSESSAIVAVHARNGMMTAGMKEFTSAVYFVKLAKFPQPAILPPQAEAVGNGRQERDTEGDAGVKNYEPFQCNGARGILVARW